MFVLLYAILGMRLLHLSLIFRGYLEISCGTACICVVPSVTHQLLYNFHCEAKLSKRYQVLLQWNANTGEGERPNP